MHHLTFAVLATAVLTGAPSVKSIYEDDTESYLKLFDEFSFEVFNKQEWNRLGESHADNVLVIWPDGHQTRGLERYREELAAMFAYAPDTRILEHPAKFGDDEWTAVTGLIAGTFTKPMALPGGKLAQPTNKTFKLSMVTIGRWKDLKMYEVQLFWDNREFMRQLGLSK